MKNVLTILILLCFITIEAQIINIPDPIFKLRLIDRGVDTNNDGEIQVSEAEAQLVLNVHSIGQTDKITNLEGLQYFINLIEFGCGYNEISTIDLTTLGQLELLWADENLLTTIDLNPVPNLETLHLTANQISNIDLTTVPNLSVIRLDENPVIDIDCSQTQAYIISCFDCLDLRTVNVRNGAWDIPDPDLLYFPLYFWNTPSFESICMDPEDMPALLESGFDPQAVAVSTLANCELGIDEFNTNFATVYPNPVRDRLFIQSDLSIRQFELTDLSGKVIVRCKSFQAIQQLFVQLRSGLYFLKVESDTNLKQTLKLLKN